MPYAIEGKQYYQLSCVDHHSSWRLIRAYSNKDMVAVMSFLKELGELCPFYIKQIQTDNDLSFTDKFRRDTDGEPSGKHLLDMWCEQNGVEHKLIPVGQKELNGKVENTHKWDDREHFSQISPKTLSELQAATFKNNDKWNNKRATKALEWRTPVQTLYAAQFMVRFFNL